LDLWFINVRYSVLIWLQQKWWSLASLIFLEYWTRTWRKEELFKSADMEGLNTGRQVPFSCSGRKKLPQ
jgi:hypothetical protein